MTLDTLTLDTLTPKKGTALLSVLAISSISLIIVSVVILASIVNSKMDLTRFWSEKAWQASLSLADDTVIKFIRTHACSSQYQDWTQPCLQIQDVQCKMSCTGNTSGASIEVWSKTGTVMKHLKQELQINADDSVEVYAPEEIY